jgi:hypothetical protein
MVVAAVIVATTAGVDSTGNQGFFFVTVTTIYIAVTVLTVVDR